MGERFSIQSRLTLLTSAACVALLVGLTAFFSLGSIATRDRQVFDARTLLSQQQDADMMHDALHADVLAATPGRVPDPASAQLQVVQDAERLRNDLDRDGQQLQILHDPALTAQFNTARQVLDDYAQFAERLVALGGSSPAAAAALLPEFTRRFRDAEARMAALTGALRTASVRAQDAAIRTAHVQQQRAAGIAGLAALVLVALAFGVRRSIQRTLREKAAVQDDVRRANEQLHDDAARRQFESALTSAFDMSLSEADAYDVVRVGVQTAAADRRAELLLADNSRAHLNRVMVEPVGDAPGCGVSSPNECIAVRRGRTSVFGSPNELGACPKLRGRDREIGAAICAPVTFLGEGLGVLHVVSGVHEAADADSAETLGRIAAEAGNRIGTLRASQRTQLQATTDGLTGLLNRRSAEDRVRELQSLGVPLAVALCDLDHFKSINDTFGHETGDRALRLFSATLRSVMRSEDVVARYGGEEFLLVMPGCHADTAHEVLGRIRTELELTLHGGGAPNFTASFGLAMAGPERPFEEAVRAADRALMTAKDEGRDRIVMDSAAVRP
jgi:diguanylate cyclase (GGDEF)-like protein